MMILHRRFYVTLADEFYSKSLNILIHVTKFYVDAVDLVILA